MKIIIASANRHKVAEIKKIISLPFVLFTDLHEMGFTDTIVEDGASYAENALIKAEAIYKRYGLPVIADDSGIEVEQLDLQPGIYSARYAGEKATDAENNKKVADALRGCIPPHRACYVCAAVYKDAFRLQTFFGFMQGEFITEPRGNNGFGYDPHFIAEGQVLTNGELDPEVKNSLSHRYHAFKQLQEYLKKEFGE